MQGIRGQRLGNLSLVQVSDQPLNFFLLNQEGNSTNVISTVFKVDEKLSNAIPVMRKDRRYFYGLVVFGENSNNILGGVGRFYNQNKLIDIESYIVQWDGSFYQLKVVRDRQAPAFLEVIPVFFDSQKKQRNCRWYSS